MVSSIQLAVVLILIIIALALISLIFHIKGTKEIYEKERYFEETFNHSGTGMALVSMKGEILRANKSLCDMLGYPVEELTKLSTVELVYQADSDKDKEYIHELFSGLRSFYQIEKRYLHKKGYIVWTILNVSLIRDKKGNTINFLAQAQNITKHKKLQHDLMDSNKRYETLLNSFDDSIIVLDQEMRYVVINQHAVSKINELTRSKFTVDTILGCKIEDLYTGFEHTEAYKTYRMLLKTKGSDTIIEEYDMPNGEKNWYELYVNSVPEGILVVSKDITRRIRNEKLIIQKELKYRSLVEQSLDGIMLIDEEGIIIEFNQEMEVITGLKKEQVVGRESWEVHFELMPSNLRNEQAYDKIRRTAEKTLMENNEIYNRKIKGTLQRTNGELVMVEEYCYPIITENFRRTCFIVRDVTELEKLEVIKEKAVESEKLLNETIELDKLRTEFFANLSHEFRTPLTIILSANKMLFDHIEFNEIVSKEFQLKYLNASKQNCFRLLRLINNIIDVTKIDSGYFDIDLKCRNIVAVVEDISQSIVDYAKNKNISVIFDTDIEEKYINCDADKIERIILNLLSNAIKFTDAGGSIYINIHDREKFIEISVADTGIGIPEEKLPMIFERFRQVDKSLARKHEGSGIGLSLVKSLVELHGGTINVTSTQGKGTIFKITLPLTGECETSEIFEHKNVDNKIEKVNIEFSDIYF